MLAVPVQIVLLSSLFVLAPAHADSSAPTPSSVSIVLVHGAWADGSSWDSVVPILAKKGYQVVAVHLPLTSTADDVAAVNRAIERQPGDVVLAGHSYGGVVISEAGNNPKVKALVFVDAFALDDGESMNGLTKAKPPAWAKKIQVDSGGFGWLTPELVANDFAQDLPATTQLLVVSKQGPLPMKDFDVVMHDPAWKSKPSWFVRGTADHMIDPAAQAMMAKRANAKVTSIEASHVSMLSKPRDVAQVIVEAATAPTTTASR
jgi:pimeloyl-ACP methyl ester carboxylesterase